MGNCNRKGYCKNKDDYLKNCKLDNYTCDDYLTLNNEILKGRITMSNFIEDVKNKILNFIKK